MAASAEEREPARPPRLTEGGRRRLVRTGTLSAGVVLVALLLAIVNYFGWKYHARFDWTGSRLYTLSEVSRNVLKGLKDDVQAVVFLGPQDQLYSPVRELLERYAAASPHVKVRVVDQEKNPVEASQLVKQYQVTSPGVVFATAKDRRVIDSTELADYDFTAVQFGQKPEMTGFKGEQLFTSALLQLSEGRKPKILFTTGHGEASLDDTGQRGLSGMRDILGRDNYQIEEWASLGKPAVPEGTDLVVIAGPKGSFVQPELDALSAYLGKDGRVLVMADPVLGPTANVPGGGLVSTGLEGWLARYGVKLGDDIVVDPANALPFFGAETLFARSYGEQPVVTPLKQGNLPVLFTVVRSAGKGTPPAGLEVTPLVETGAEGWGETNLADLGHVAKDARDVAGPVPLGVAVSRAGEKPPAGDEEAPAPAPAPPKPGGPRLIVFGDSDFADNQLLDANVGNSVLLSNAFNWLVERESLIGIPPKKTENVHLSLSSGELRTIYLLSLAVLPGLGVLMGVLIYFRRRR
jgi:gliding motility-associatede transport system auxiliary component